MHRRFQAVNPTAAHSATPRTSRSMSDTRIVGRGAGDGQLLPSTESSATVTTAKNPTSLTTWNDRTANARMTSAYAGWRRQKPWRQQYAATPAIAAHRAMLSSPDANTGLHS